MQEEIDGYGEPQSKTREQIVEEANRAQDAILSSAFGDGTNAVFSKSSTEQDPKTQKRMQLMDRLAASIASKLGEQFANLPAMIAESLKQPQSQPSQSQQDSQSPPRSHDMPSTSVQSQQVPWTPEQASQVPQTSSIPDYRPQLPEPEDVRPKSIRRIPADQLPLRPAGFDPNIPMRSLDDEVERPSEPSRQLPDRDKFPLSFNGMRSDQEPRKPFNPGPLESFSIPPQPAYDSTGRPTFDATGTQVDELTELGREFADSNQQFHAALVMFIRQVVTAQQQTTEELYQAMTVLERMESV